MLAYKNDVKWWLLKYVINAINMQRVCDSVCVCAVVLAYGQLKSVDIDSVAVERDTLLRQVALCCLLNIVDLPFLDGIANDSESEQVSWPASTGCNGIKLTYENPLFASTRSLLYFYHYLMYSMKVLMLHYACCTLDLTLHNVLRVQKIYVTQL